MPTATADQPAQPQGPSLEEAAHRIEGLLDLQETEGNPEPSDDAADAARTNGESVAADVPSKETPQEEEGSDEAEASEEADSSEAATEAPVTITVKLDGKTKTISAEEAANGYQRYADYTRKTEELATERKSFEAHANAVQEERQTYATMLVALRDQLQELQPEEPDWAEVYRGTPLGTPGDATNGETSKTRSLRRTSSLIAFVARSAKSRKRTSGNSRSKNGRRCLI